MGMSAGFVSLHFATPCRIRKEAAMDRKDLLWVGLKLLGVTFLILALGQAGYGAYQLSRVGFRLRDVMDFTREWVLIEASRNLVQAAVYLVGGLTLVLGTNWLVGSRGTKRVGGSDSAGEQDRAA
jgi:hypothetical protein